jgi:hypothetical protein
MDLRIIGTEQERFFEAYRFGIYCVLIFLVGGVRGIAIGFRAIESSLAMGLVAMPTMLALSFMLSVSSMRLILHNAY